MKKSKYEQKIEDKIRKIIKEEKYVYVLIEYGKDENDNTIIYKKYKIDLITLIVFVNQFKKVEDKYKLYKRIYFFENSFFSPRLYFDFEQNRFLPNFSESANKCIKNINFLLLNYDEAIQIAKEYR